MPASDKESELKTIEIALLRASSWFEIHASQRLKLFNFYVLFFLGIVAGFATITKEKIGALEFALSALLLLITISFKYLDMRTATLVKQAESALDEVEARIAGLVNAEKLRLIRVSEYKGNGLSYRQAFNIVFFAGVAFALIGFITAVVHACQRCGE